MGNIGSNLPSKRNKVSSPTNLNIRLFLQHNGNMDGNDSHWCDIAQLLSALNRRAYRQGLYYYVQSATVHDSNQNAWVKFATAPNTWTVKNGWVRAYRMWNKMNSRALADVSDLRNSLPKYHDFKVYLNAEHRSAVIGNVDVPEPALSGDGGGGGTVAVGEWVYSQYYTDDPHTGGATPAIAHAGDGFDVHLLGPHVSGGVGNWHSIGATESYMDSRALPVSSGAPTMPVDFDSDPLANLFDAGDTMDDVRENLDEHNDQTPYNLAYPPGAGFYVQTVLVSQTACSAGAGAVAVAPGFVAPCGLVEIITNSAVNGTIEVVLNIAPGSYHGVLAERIV